MKKITLIVAALAVLIISLNIFVHKAVDQGCMNQCLKGGYTYGYCYAKCTY